MECTERNLITRLDFLPLVMWSHAFWPSVSWNLHITRRFDLRSLSPALRYLWLLSVVVSHQNIGHLARTESLPSSVGDSTSEQFSSTRDWHSSIFLIFLWRSCHYCCIEFIAMMASCCSFKRWMTLSNVWTTSAWTAYKRGLSYL